MGCITRTMKETISGVKMSKISRNARLVCRSCIKILFKKAKNSTVKQIMIKSIVFEVKTGFFMLLWAIFLIKIADSNI